MPSMMMSEMRSNLLVVPPFECAWLADENLMFPEIGRGCIAFEACTDNDITVVLKEKAGSKHYRTDPDPYYAIVLGSHRNRRIKIEMDGIPVFDAPGVVISPSSSRFERFWISIFDGHICVGKGDPGKGILFEWKHSDTIRGVRYVGLSSWDKHVGYRNIRVLSCTEMYSLHHRQQQQQQLEKSFTYSNTVSRGLDQFLESYNFADLHFCVGIEERLVPAHRLVLACCCPKFRSSLNFRDDVIHLPNVEYQVLHAFLQYIYTGKTQLSYSYLNALESVSDEFGLNVLTRQCQEILKEANDGYISEGTMRLVCNSGVESNNTRLGFAANSPVDPLELKNIFNNGEFSDVDVFIDGINFVAQGHKLVLSAWSIPFAKMFTNGMQESKLSKIDIKDVQHDVLLAMLKFMYSTQPELNDIDDVDLLSLTILADRFDIPLLQSASNSKLVEEISEESVIPILRVAASLPCCELLVDACVEFFAKNFESCLNHGSHLKDLDLSSFKRVLQSSDLCVTTEEGVLNAIIQWASIVDHLHDWREAIHYLQNKSLEELFGDRLTSLSEVLNFVRFALMPPPLLLEMQSCCLGSYLPKWKDMVDEALQYLAADRGSGSMACKTAHNRDRLIQLSYNSVRFSHRASSLKELLYIRDGDSNGVIYFAGTSYGAHAWMNPVLTKKISVVASSPPSRLTDPKSLVSRQYQGTSFAGPYFEGGHPSSWWKIDLGNDNRLMCNHYTLRQDGSMNYIRSWSLQGSNDEKNWLDLRVHSDDRTLSHAGQFASWPIHASHAYMPFRFFRVILTGPTSSALQPWNFCICYIELYGYFKCGESVLE